MVGSMIVRKGSRVLLLAALLAGTATIGPAAANVCINAKERALLETRVVQTELMVAALSCSESDRYNAFVNGFKRELRLAHSGLQAFFRRSYQGRADRELNKFLTRLANESSLRSLEDRPAFCEQADGMFEALSNLERDKAFTSAVSDQSVAVLHGYEVCDGTPSRMASAKADDKEAAKRAAKQKKPSTLGLIQEAGHSTPLLDSEISQASAK